ncbi:MAG: site-specific DNA-methyltransferase [Desulfarculus sp.]|jgi:site-specific DNA-methyltransferase (cytosine-N4-specific)|nr:MAG: site-specific DNA-methyltransferase [Desulfarculus sp.]
MLNKLSPIYTTQFGRAYCGDSIDLLKRIKDESINLVITSPPFALLRKKEYGNKPQDEFVDWLARFAKEIFRIITKDGSFVLDLGHAYQKSRPVRSLYNYKILINFCEELRFNLAEEFFWHNPAKLPSPIEWVNKRKIRIKDSVNTVWWFSKIDFPQADARNVLVPYSERMKKLLRDSDKFYSPKKRPSGHDISKHFSRANGGAIPPNLLEIPNTESNSQYLRYCKIVGIKGHPARFPVKLPEFFIKFLTKPGDIVLDIFAGSNATGEAAESLERHWLAFELNIQYLAASIFRFLGEIEPQQIKKIYESLSNGNLHKYEASKIKPISMFNSALSKNLDDIFITL